MRQFFLFVAILFFAMNIVSCRSTRTMTYFQDVNDGVQLGMPAKVPEYLIRTDDNLYVNIQSMNQEVNQLFSPTKMNSSGGTQSDFGDVTSQYLNGYLVNQKGMILLPVVGEVYVRGMNEEGAKDAIQKKVGEYFKDATVKVKLLTYKVTILGEVKNPGVYYNYNKSISVLDLLGRANGTTDFASIRKVLVLRPTANGNKSYRLDLTGKAMMASEAFYLFPNDVVYIEPDTYINHTLNTTTLTIALTAISTTILILSYINK